MEELYPVTRAGLGFIYVVLIAGCGYYGTFKGGIFKNREVKYRVGTLSSDWTLLKVRDNNLAFFNEKLGATIQANAMCKDIDDVSLKVLTNHLLIGLDGRKKIFSRRLPFDGREALQTVVEGKLDGVAIKLDIYVLRKNNCVYDFAYFTRRGHFDRGRADYRRFVKGFKSIR